MIALPRKLRPIVSTPENAILPQHPGAIFRPITRRDRTKRGHNGDPQGEKPVGSGSRPCAARCGGLSGTPARSPAEAHAAASRCARANLYAAIGDALASATSCVTSTTIAPRARSATTASTRRSVARHVEAGWLVEQDRRGSCRARARARPAAAARASRRVGRSQKPVASKRSRALRRARRDAVAAREQREFSPAQVGYASPRAPAPERAAKPCVAPASSAPKCSEPASAGEQRRMSSRVSARAVGPSMTVTQPAGRLSRRPPAPASRRTSSRCRAPPREKSIARPRP